jgi:hypothetical protein
MSEFDLATFVVIVSLWLATIWLAYRIGLQSVKDEQANIRLPLPPLSARSDAAALRAQVQKADGASAGGSRRCFADTGRNRLTE